MDENISCMVGLLFICLFAGWAWFITRPNPRCPECESKRVEEITKESLGMLDGGASIGSGGEGGGYGNATIRYKITMKCVDCNAQWVKTVTETG